jgi:hypothetical protein
MSSIPQTTVPLFSNLATPQMTTGGAGVNHETACSIGISRANLDGGSSIAGAGARPRVQGDLAPAEARPRRHLPWTPRRLNKLARAPSLMQQDLHCPARTCEVFYSLFYPPSSPEYAPERHGGVHLLGENNGGEDVRVPSPAVPTGDLPPSCNTRELCSQVSCRARGEWPG